MYCMVCWSGGCCSYYACLNSEATHIQDLIKAYISKFLMKHLLARTLYQYNDYVRGKAYGQTGA